MLLPLGRRAVRRNDVQQTDCCALAASMHFGRQFHACSFRTCCRAARAWRHRAPPGRRLCSGGRCCARSRARHRPEISMPSARQSWMALAQQDTAGRRASRRRCRRRRTSTFSISTPELISTMPAESGTCASPAMRNPLKRASLNIFRDHRRPAAERPARAGPRLTRHAAAQRHAALETHLLAILAGLHLHGIAGARFGQRRGDGAEGACRRRPPARAARREQPRGAARTSGRPENHAASGERSPPRRTEATGRAPPDFSGAGGSWRARTPRPPPPPP